MKTAASRSTKTASAPSGDRLQLGCLAASPATVRAAIDHGADWVRVPYRQIGPTCDTRWQDFVIGRLGKAIRYAHHKRRKVVLDLSAPASPSMWPHLRKMISLACDEGIDALMLSDPALAICSAIHHPNLTLHFAVPRPTSGKAARQLQIRLGAGRILLPPPFSLANIGELAAIAGLELEVLGFGNGVPSASRRIKGQQFESSETLSLELDDDASNDASYSLGGITAGALYQLPKLVALGVRAIQIEPPIETPGDVAQVTKVWRAAIDKCTDDAAHYMVNPSWIRLLDTRRTIR